MPSLYALIEIVVLILNGLAVLHDERFLAYCAFSACYDLLHKHPWLTFAVFVILDGFGYKQDADQFGQVRSGVKQKVAELLYAIRLIGRGTDRPVLF